MELCHYLCWLLKVFPRTFWCEIQTTVWIRSPAVASFVPEVVWVCIGMVLDSIVACTIEISITLQYLWSSARGHVLITKVDEHECRSENLKSNESYNYRLATYEDECNWLRPVLLSDDSVPVPATEILSECA